MVNPTAPHISVDKQVLNWGLLSTARINRALIPVLKRSARNRVTAVASRRESTAEDYARQWGIPQAYGSYDALLRDPDVDVIYNPLPNSLHASWTIKALRAGKNVLCEKPLAVTLEEVDAMTSAARETGKVLAEAFMYRHHPQTFKVKNLVDSGALGRLQLIKGAFTFVLNRAGDIRWMKEMGGGGLWDVGCYPISYARMITQAEPVEVFGWWNLGDGGADVSFVGQLRFPNDVYAQFDCGFLSPSRSFMEIVGSEGSLNVPTPFKPGRNERIFFIRSDKTETVKIKGEELYRGEIEDIAEVVFSGKPPRISLADSRGNVAAILALLESAATGKPVKPRG